MRLIILALATVLIVGALQNAQGQDEPAKKQKKSAWDFQMKDIDGQKTDLGQFRGKVALVVNVASQCGLTPQYKGLQSLQDRYADRGLVVMGFPCNQFGGQEPGAEAEIKEFCESKYNVSFKMFSKINVNGDQQADLYQFLTSQQTAPVGPGDISWNFEKFLIDRNGNVLARFAPRTKPDDPELIKAIEGALAEK